MKKELLVTGSSGLIGSEVCCYFANELGYKIHGVDNNQRAAFFEPQGDTRWNQRRLADTLPDFQHHELYIRDRAGLLAPVRELRPDVIVHTAARAAAISGRSMKSEYVDKAREGDHICYISDLAKMITHYPAWNISKSLDQIFREIHDSWVVRLEKTSPLQPK